MRRFTEKFFVNDFLDKFCASATSDHERKEIVSNLLAKFGTSEKDDLLALTDETNTVKLQIFVFEKKYTDKSHIGTYRVPVR